MNVSRVWQYIFFPVSWGESFGLDAHGIREVHSSGGGTRSVERRCACKNGVGVQRSDKREQFLQPRSVMGQTVCVV